MAKQAKNKFTWVIKNYSSSHTKVITSDLFVIGGCKWRLVAYPKGHATSTLPILLSVVNFDNLPCGWRRHAKCRITLANKEKLSEMRESQIWFDKKDPILDYKSMIPRTKVDGKYCRFVYGEIKIVVEIEILEVIGKVDVVEEIKEATHTRKRMKLDINGAVSTHMDKEASLVNESIDVNGFQILPSQVDFVRLMFEKHPEIASDFRMKNPILKTAYMNVLLSVTETLRKSAQEVSKDDLVDGFSSLGSLRDAGFKVDWLETKLNEMSERKDKEEACETRMQEIEQELNNLKAKMLAARAPLGLDDVFG